MKHKGPLLGYSKTKSAIVTGLIWAHAIAAAAGLVALLVGAI